MYVRIKELIDKGVCNKGFIWNPSNCDYECDKSCDIGEYLDYSNCKCRKKLVDKLIEECTENIDEVEINSENEHKCSSCILYIVLFSMFFTISIRIATYFAYFYWYIKKDVLVVCLIPVLKQQFIETYINGRSPRNKYKKSNILFF